MSQRYCLTGITAQMQGSEEAADAQDALEAEYDALEASSECAESLSNI